ncbi:MAG: hypothetical protein COT74_08945 [Bdellovibrionales bacterium CG10_big_fil_rev_8_21_14_0_10_45_34]|nr:MAG: hypothetical protein COT74_08945 [Bdellovibrionales bacterium CG10_big_fil_rev_8_21_14_0_10_45_34]
MQKWQSSSLLKYLTVRRRALAFFWLAVVYSFFTTIASQARVETSVVASVSGDYCASILETPVAVYVSGDDGSAVKIGDLHKAPTQSPIPTYDKPEKAIRILAINGLHFSTETHAEFPRRYKRRPIFDVNALAHQAQVRRLQRFKEMITNSQADLVVFSEAVDVYEFFTFVSDNLNGAYSVVGPFDTPRDLRNESIGDSLSAISNYYSRENIHHKTFLLVRNRADLNSDKVFRKIGYQELGFTGSEAHRIADEFLRPPPLVGVFDGEGKCLLIVAGLHLKSSFSRNNNPNDRIKAIDKRTREMAAALAIDQKLSAHPKFKDATVIFGGDMNVSLDMGAPELAASVARGFAAPLPGFYENFVSSSPGGLLLYDPRIVTAGSKYENQTTISWIKNGMKQWSRSDGFLVRTPTQNRGGAITNSGASPAVTIDTWIPDIAPQYETECVLAGPNRVICWDAFSDHNPSFLDVSID